MIGDKLVSIILPVYNAEKYIADACDSIIHQTYTNLEIIIINDGSKDHSLDILKEYEKKDERIVLISRENLGLVYSLNEAISVAKGDYIARMDADDISYLTRIEKQVEYMNQHEDVYLLGTNYELIYDEDASNERIKTCEGTLRRSRETIDEENSFLSTNETMKIIHPSIMMRKELFHIVGLYRNYKSEDMELYFRVGANGLKIAKLNDILLKYRVQNNSKSFIETRSEQTRELIEMKLDYLIHTVPDRLNNVDYYIWGADISGKIAYEIIQSKIKNSRCLAFIDSYKSGVSEGVPILPPTLLKCNKGFYVFVCTQAGAKDARIFLKNNNLVEIQDFFKIS